MHAQAALQALTEFVAWDNEPFTVMVMIGYPALVAEVACCVRVVNLPRFRFRKHNP
jgi:hypothetical protein